MTATKGGTTVDELRLWTVEAEPVQPGRTGDVMAIRRTSLGLCAICTEPPYPDGDCDCAVDMKVCDVCGNGPLNDSDPDRCDEHQET